MSAITATSARVTARLLSGFDDPAADGPAWEALLRAGESDVVFLTCAWQRAWWECFGRGRRLLLVLAERDGRPVALAPLFTDAGMIYLVGSGGSDYLDLVGDTSDAVVLDALLATARDAVEGFLGLVFYHVPERSATGARLAAAAGRLGLSCLDEGELPAPALDLAGRPEEALAATRKKSLVRHEKALRAAGPVEVLHLTDGQAVLPHLEVFFDQHERRWAATPHPSLFRDEAQRRFYRRLAELAPRGPASWLRFTRVDWCGRPVAFHFGASYRGSYLWYKPSFEVELATRSPGEVLLRQLLLAAMAEGAHTFDFGLGDEAFKARFATRVRRVRNWGLYPPSAVGAAGSQEGA